MINIQKATVEDAARITMIKKEAYNDETRRFGPGRDGGPEGYDSIKENIRLISEFDVYKVIYEDKVIGCFWVIKDEEDCYELEDLCIHPNYHNRGLGQKVMVMMEEILPDAKKWKLATPHYSTRNQHVYEKRGYKKIGEAEDGFLFLYEKYITW